MSSKVHNGLYIKNHIQFMSYIRAKTVRGQRYLYLVQSKWNSQKQTSKQKIIKYLGKDSQATIDDIPLQYRSSPNIVKFFKNKECFETDNQIRIIKKFRGNLENSLLEGNILGAHNLFESYSEIYGAKKFFDDVLFPVKAKIDHLLGKNQISDGTHTVCYNGMLNLIQKILDSIKPNPKKGKVLVCTSYGQQHILENKFVELQFAWKNHTIVNAPSFSSASDILFIIKREEPSIVFVTIARKDDIPCAKCQKIT